MKIKKTLLIVILAISLNLPSFSQNQEDKKDNLTAEKKTEFNILKYGISPLIGVNYFLTPNLSLGTEIKFSATGYSGKAESSFQYGEPPYLTYGDSENKFNGFRTYFGPLGYLSINIYF